MRAAALRELCRHDGGAANLLCHALYIGALSDVDAHRRGAACL
ncbi:hypothetical protein [Mycetohabitans rhizoxinica]|nr:hypothetical protein [Mycetohabitans rhizoxinica]